ncbi:MAG TPA: hypothetical protein VGK67_37895 [Myxococcales bacterium]
MEELRIPKAQVSLKLALSNGDLEGKVFLADYAATHAGPERLLDVLGGPDRFFPVQSEGVVRLVCRDAVRWVRLGAENFDDPPQGLTQEEVAVLLRDGTRLEGTARFDAPAGRARLLDYLNAPGHFLPLFEAGEVTLVNRSEIAEVRFKGRAP